MTSSFLAFPPPSWVRRFRSDDLDEVRDFVARRDGEHSRVAHRGGALGFELSWLSGTTASVGWSEVALRKTIRGAVRDPVLHVAMPPGSMYRIGRRERLTGQGTATFLAPEWEFTRHSPPGRSFVISVDRRKLREEIEARLPGGRGDLLLRSRAIELADDMRTRLVILAGQFVQAMGPGSDARAVQRSEADLLAAVAGLLLDESAVARADAMSSARVADLEAWIEAHLDRPITMGRLCHVAGVGERALQKVFESHRGISPMRFVTERRLAAARRRLTSALPGNDVTSVAVSLGFGHPGRFAGLYREAFGEAPSQSLRRQVR